MNSLRRSRGRLDGLFSTQTLGLRYRHALVVVAPAGFPTGLFTKSGKKRFLLWPLCISTNIQTRGNLGSRRRTNDAAPHNQVTANPMVIIGGGLAIVAAIGLMFMPKPKQIELEEGQKKPDVRYEARPHPARYMA